MPITKSAAKAARQNLRRYRRNLAVKKRMKSDIKALLAAIAKSDTQAVAERLNQAQSALDKAAKTGVIHKQKAARQKSRLTKLANSSGQTKAGNATMAKKSSPTKPAVATKQTDSADT
ncbi:30S ribosomal protein S20 [Candidatus Microgenomates bacterium]|nr:30S ribosomal protein S20 [Candidatus Microgenomates bacterium]